MNESLKSDLFFLLLGGIFVYFGIQGVKKDKEDKENSIMSFNYRTNLGFIISGVVFIILGLFKILIDL
jgi:hypothetical protein